MKLMTFLNNIVFKNRVGVSGGIDIEASKDPRDLKYESITELGAKDVSSLPREYMIPIMYYHNQRTSDMCTGFSTAEASEDQEGEVLHPEFQFAVGKRKRRGDYRTWGNSAQAVLGGVITYGSIPLKAAVDMVLGKKSRDFLANWKNWPSNLWELAKKFRKKSYFSIYNTRGLDKFDSIRLALWENKHRKRSGIGIAYWHRSWNRPPNGIIPQPPYSGKRTGHMFEIPGFIEIAGVEYLIIYPNYGKDLGEQGLVYMDRETANKELESAYMLVDMDVDVAKFVNKYAGKCVMGGRPFIYYIQAGKKRHVKNMDIFNALGFEDKEGDGGYHRVNEGDVLAIPTGKSVTVKDLPVSLQQLFLRHSILGKAKDIGK